MKSRSSEIAAAVAGIFKGTGSVDDLPKSLTSDSKITFKESPDVPSTSLTPSQRRHLQTELAELMASYETLTKRIHAVDGDIGRTLDGLQKRVMMTRREELRVEREQVARRMSEIEAQLST